MSFNNREIASLVWLTIFIIGILIRPNIRKSVQAVIRAAFQPLLIRVVLVMALYTAGCIAILAHHQLWTLDNLKTTVLWFFTFAVMATFQRGASEKIENFIGDTLRQTLAVTVIVEFLVGAYSFGLIAELILVPVVTFAAIMSAFAGTKPENALVKKLFDWILAIVGFTYFFYALYQAAAHFRDFATIENAREFLHPIMLSLMFMPFMYLFHVYATYEQVFAGINWKIEDRRLNRYAKWRAFWHFRTDTDFLRRWRRMVVTTDPQTRADMNAIFAALKKRKAVEAHPPAISPTRGWSPFAAQHFLAAEGFKMDYYHALYDDEWMSSSTPVKLKRTTFDGTITYRIYGDEEAATKLSLDLDMMTMEESDAADAEFIRLMVRLMGAALGPDVGAKIAQALEDGSQTTSAEVGYWKVSLTREDHEYKLGPGYERELTIQCRGIPSKHECA